MEPELYDLQWQALRYAVDMIDVAWSFEQTHEDYKRPDMRRYREVLVKMQDEVLAAKYAAQN